MSRSWPMRLGSPLKNHTWLTGEASSMWPMRSRRTRARVTSTPHLSHTTPANFIRLYLPHAHRSEEHTSELQSQSNLVCRLLLEKKKNAQNTIRRTLFDRALDYALTTCTSR